MNSKSSRSLIRIGVAVVCLWFLIWLAMAVITHAPFSSVEELSGLLAAIGGIMGAVFTVGGLVIALVAVLSQLQLQDRIQRLLTDSQQQIEQRFQQELLPSLERQAQAQIEGSLSFFQATLAGNDWKVAQRLTHEALERYPKLAGARSFLGQRLASLVIAYFAQELNPSTTIELASTTAFAQSPTVFTLDPPSPYNPQLWPVSINAAQTQALEPPRIEAIEWLRDALAHGEDPDGFVSANLAVVYGFNQAYDMMFGAIRDALAKNRAHRSFFLTPTLLAMLTYACRNDESRLNALGQLLNYSLPIPWKSIASALATIPWADVDFVDWHALEVSRPGKIVSPYPATIRIFRPRQEPGGKGWIAYVFPHNGYQEMVPRVTEGSEPGATILTAEALVEQFKGRFLFTRVAASWPASIGGEENIPNE